ncbi:hypothetical protein PC121_g8529 [Phytophthora cactorum]|nr:hypothetical protein PC120_g14535 [Phytophthora cactorum]KAG3073748.1 hypothetical protein PC121_g8529 [Phytophthora cactorum]KAG4049947.1 hypothetical protein PC123_g14794 [Phytophthora cactorum]
MGFTKVRGIFETNKPRSGSQYLESSKSTFEQSRSFSRKQSNDLEHEIDQSALYKPPSDTEMLHRARESHMSVDFEALSGGPEKGGPWQRVEATDEFIVCKRPLTADIKDNRLPGLEVMCAGQFDASVEEVASVFRSNSDIDHANTMEGLYKKNFIFGSLDREVPCSEESQNQDDDSNANSNEQLNVKTTSFLRSTLFGRNEQWCFSDFFQRIEERDGFRIFQCALPPFEPTPGRVVGENARVDQLHGLNASYLVDQLPDDKGLRVVYNAWFEDPMKDIEASTSSTEKSQSSQSFGLSVSSSGSSKGFQSLSSGSDRSLLSQSSDRRRSSGLLVASNPSFIGLNEAADGKAQLRRLLSLAHGMTKLPDLISRRRFGIQVPADLEAIQVENTRCPCCTHSLTPVKMSLSLAASAFANRSLRSLKSDTRRCYLCGYLVCMDCWRAECMESTVGRVAAIVVCTRCHASVKACDYSEVYAPGQEECRGPVKVVDDRSNNSLAPLLTEFLSTSLMNTASSEDRAAVLSVVRTLLQQSEQSQESDDSDSFDEGFDELHNDNVSVVELGKYLSDDNQLPELETCVFANSKKRGYPIAQPDDPVTMVPPTIIPPHEQVRLRLVNDKGLMLLAKELAPVDPAPDAFENVTDVRDLDILCHLAVRASGCPNTFLSIMGTEHLHILSSSNPAFLHATMPREHTVCQHTIMTPKPFIISHPEADVRFHELGAIKALSTRCYMGFPLTVPMTDCSTDKETEMPVGTLCCVTPQARSELSRSQYVTLRCIADTASRLIQLKSRQLQEQQNAASLAS